jgi:histidine triad (HIT) family protein
MASIFTKIINREMSGHIVRETDKFIAILDIFPSQPGHTLVIPKQEIDYIFDLPDNLYTELWEEVRIISEVLKKVTGRHKIGIKVEGLQVPHVHVHLIPIDKPQDFNAKASVSQEEMQELVQKIQRELTKSE